jgi:hypothetical protein
MTLASTQAAAATIPRHPLWGIGRYSVAGSPVDFPISWEDWERDTAWIQLLLAEHGLGADSAGSGIVVVSGMPESPWFDPVETAARQLGAPFSIGEVLQFEAFRTGLYALRLPIGMIFGINAAVAQGLGDELAAVLQKVPTVFARPSAIPVVEASGGRPFLVTRLGPALAVECPLRSGAHVNGAEWTVTDDEGQLRITTAGPRAFQTQAAATGVSGSVDRSPCLCGRTDPRVTVDPEHAL